MIVRNRCMHGGGGMRGEFLLLSLRIVCGSTIIQTPVVLTGCTEYMIYMSICVDLKPGLINLVLI